MKLPENVVYVLLHKNLTGNPNFPWTFSESDMYSDARLAVNAFLEHSNSEPYLVTKRYCQQMLDCGRAIFVED